MLEPVVYAMELHVQEGWMRTIHRLVVIIAVVTSSLYAVKHVVAAEVDIVIVVNM